MDWNKANLKQLKSLYKGDNSELPAIAETLGTTVASVRGKLVSEKLYTKSEAVAAKSVTATKQEHRKAIEILLSTKEGDLKSLENSNAVCLELLTKQLIALSEKENLSQ